MKRLLNTLTWKQSLSILIAAGAVVAGLVAFSHWNLERDFRPLLQALSPEDAGAHYRQAARERVRISLGGQRIR